MPVQVASILVTVLLLFGIIASKVDHFTSTDGMPQILPLVPTKDLSASGAVAHVKAGMFFYDFPVFDMVKNNFLVDAIVWFQFDPTVISLDAVGKFSFEKGTILKRSEPSTKMINDELFARYLVRIKLSSTLDYKYFPMDDHRLYIVLTNELLTPSELRFVVSEAGLGISPTVYTQGWRPVGKAVRSGYAIAKLDSYDETKVVKTPRAAFIIDFGKPGLRKVLLIFAPIFLLLLMGLSSLFFDHEKGARAILSLSVGSLSGLLGYRFVIEKLSPEVSYYTLTDHMYTMVLGLLFLLVLFNMFIMRKEYTLLVRKIKFAIFVGIEVLVIAVWYYLLYHWGR